MEDESIEELTPEIVTDMIIEQAIESLPDDLQPTVENYINEVLTRKKIPAESLLKQDK
ncbi:hypothetical protein TRFO_18105 [Tritrichomonas foetus]|uniref:Uncharacterized protein n=1 Tax=Tritrichomonas foetus TaxID=1144522 RepID=A0A1J4KMS8_9EUKA|nr:hypothetical protein TRFO_18105 [Tritrichomonas foetus]|eukprot:OHT12200.1 hypothetical protein TRFO_18105 [Tritrichomonas foetus]